MIDFIIKRGGSAGYYTKKRNVSRINSNAVERFLRGEISFEKLKIALGC